MTPLAWSAAVLTGGASRRMGSDKALLPVGGVPLALRVAGALRQAGASEVLAIGGDLERLAGAGLDARPDPHQGAGPLGGVVVALAEALHPVVVVVACDLPALDAATIAAVLAGLGDADVAFAHTDRREPLCAAWRRDVAGPVLSASFASGERAVHRAAAPLHTTDVRVDPAALRDVDEPDDLERKG